MKQLKNKRKEVVSMYSFLVILSLINTCLLICNTSLMIMRKYGKNKNT